MTPPDFSTCPAVQRANVRWLFFDVDDTLTWRGELVQAGVEALYRAQAAGLSLIAVTGRSNAWAEALLRLFPLNAAIGETGAACFVKEPSGQVRVLHAEPNAQVRQENRRRRDQAAQAELDAVPSARLALDNMGREYDTAFDLVEDGPALCDEDAAQIRAILRDHGLTVVQSSVHINAFFGAFDKAQMVNRYLREVCATTLPDAAPTLAYVGDSKNDAPMFAATPLSVGVENVSPHLEALGERAPKYIVRGNGGAGFAAVVDLLLSAR